MHTCMHTYIHTCVSVCLYVCMYVYVYVVTGGTYINKSRQSQWTENNYNSHPLTIDIPTKTIGR